MRRKNGNIVRIIKDTVTIASTLILFFLAGLVIIGSLCSCSTVLDFGENRHINAVIASNGVSQATLRAFVDQFNEEAKEESGIYLDPTYIDWSFEAQQKIWPACQAVLPCFADYLVLNEIPHDVAMYVQDGGILVFGVEVLVGIPIGETDNTKYRYMTLVRPQYRAFKHEIYHAFHPGHSLSGIMFPMLSFEGVPISATSLSTASKEEVQKNKWREFK